MRIEWVGIECVSNAESPRQLLGHLPGVLRVEIEIQKVEGFVCRRRKSLCCRRCDPIDVLRQGGVCHGGDRSLPKVIVIQPEDARIGSKAEFVRTMTPCQIIIDKEPGGASSLEPRVI